MLFQKGQTIANRYTAVFPHKHESYAEFCRGSLLPQRLILVSSWNAHSGRINCRVLCDQTLDVLRECVGRIDAVEPVGDIAEMGVELVGGELPIGYPSIRKAAGETRVDNYNSIPKTSMVGTDITNDSNTAQPTAHILKLWENYG